MGGGKIHWRKAGPDDAAILSDIGNRSFIETFGHLYSAENLAAFLVNHSEASWRGELGDPLNTVRLGEQDKTAVAFAKLGPPSLPVEPAGRSIELKQFYVLTPWHGTAVARELMDWVLTEAHARGADEIYLSVFTENARAIRFYERYGFEYVAPYHFMVGTQADEDMIMRLRLQDHRL
ncbi:MAG: N-acetyltransferase family protein [Allosphingosinicella sp.]